MATGLEDWSHYTRFMLALVAVLDPFMAIPVFLSMRAGRSRAAHRRLGQVASVIVFAVLAGAAIGGDGILRVLGTSFASFRVAGGLVLLMMALAMLQARVERPRTTPETAATVDEPDISSAVPLAIPLLAGPGAISTVMIAAQGGGWVHLAALVAAIAAVCLILWLMLHLALPISRLLGATGINIANRLLGLLLAAIAVESMAAGFKGLFPALGG